LKVGTHWQHGWWERITRVTNDSIYNLLNEVPVSVTQRTTPLFSNTEVKINLGLYAQEQWTRK
jgi:hypothetical protein